MDNTVPKGGWKLGQDSFNVFVVWFQDGNVRTMYSLDWKHKFSRMRDEKIGWARYELLVTKYGANARNILISKNDSAVPRERTLLRYYQEGVQVEITDELRARIKNELSDKNEWWFERSHNY